MRPPRADNEATPFPEAHADPALRFLMRGLHQLAVDPHAAVPEDFHAAVLTRARQLPVPHPRLRAWLRARLTIWAPVLAVGLLVSLGGHVWQGFRALSSPVARVSQVTAPRRESPWPLAHFQEQLQHAPGLGALVAARPFPPVPRALVGFTPHASRSTFVQIGRLYADAVAALHGGAGEVARPRLEALLQALTNVQAPPVFVQYVREMLRLLSSQTAGDPTNAQWLALFEPLYEGVYARDPAAAAWVFFQTGAWLENLALAATADDPVAVRQAQVVQALSTALRPLRVPDTVLEALEQMRVVMTQQPLTSQDLRTIQTLLDLSQQHLSN